MLIGPRYPDPRRSFARANEQRVQLRAGATCTCRAPGLRQTCHVLGFIANRGSDLGKARLSGSETISFYEEHLTTRVFPLLLSLPFPERSTIDDRRSPWPASWLHIGHWTDNRRCWSYAKALQSK
jgi:hypothetical protein